MYSIIVNFIVVTVCTINQVFYENSVISTFLKFANIFIINNKKIFNMSEVKSKYLKLLFFSHYHYIFIE